MEHLPNLLQPRLLTLVPKTTKGLPVLLLAHTLDLLHKPVDHPHKLPQHRHPIQVLEIPKLLPMLLLAHILGLLHRQVDH